MNIEAINESKLPAVEAIPEAVRAKFIDWYGRSDHTILDVTVDKDWPDECNATIALVRGENVQLHFVHLFTIGDNA